MALLVIVVAALWVPGVARVFLIAQAVFWSLSYVARPLVLLAVRPEPHFGDNVPDPRLANLGYDRGIALALEHVMFGVWVYAGLVVAYAVWARGRPPRCPRVLDDPDFVPTLVVLYIVTMLGRAAATATGSTGTAGEVSSANPALALLAVPASIAAIGLILFVRSPDPRRTALILAGLLAGELWWSAIVQSKTPILGAALTLVIRFSMVGWSKRTALGVVGIGVVGALGFGWLQSFKSAGSAQGDADQVDAIYPENVRPFLSILRRFDLLEAATDALYYGPGGWLTPGEVAQNTSLSLIPGPLLGIEKFQSGTAWATEVRGASVDMSTVTVSLAEGNFNEGYVLGGYPGVVLGALFTFALLLTWAATLYSRWIPVVVLGLAVTGGSTLFERGVLGSMEDLGKFAQTAVLVWLVYLVVAEFRRTETTVKSGEMESQRWV
ncbi:hypothetical protein ACFWUP_01545 [Nocardia sp. NPDC058658]|uniref:hypothetical protein n=1 Tax=Nocardia sp. NPDC058658 TaxID=3346580 RepID=UPI00364F292F